MLRCETNAPEMRDKVADAFKEEESTSNCHERTSIDFEHGQWFVTCLDCGAQWSANDLDVDRFDFEEISDGDESCYELSIDDDEDDDDDDDDFDDDDDEEDDLDMQQIVASLNENQAKDVLLNLLLALDANNVPKCYEIFSSLKSDS